MIDQIKQRQAYIENVKLRIKEVEDRIRLSEQSLENLRGLLKNEEAELARLQSINK